MVYALIKTTRQILVLFKRYLLTLLRFTTHFEYRMPEIVEIDSRQSSHNV